MRMITCKYCGEDHKIEGIKCPHVKSIEFFENGDIKKIEYFSANEKYIPFPTYPISWEQPTVLRD